MSKYDKALVLLTGWFISVAVIFRVSLLSVLAVSLIFSLLSFTTLKNELKKTNK
jgi:membrane protein CcdC involved in cytochrome C biogenesis